MDRLRRLDALFAERVLGCKVFVGTSAVEALTQEGWQGTQDPCCGCGAAKHGNGGLINLPPYTRSLDAAWEGVPRMYEVSLHWQGGSIAQVKYAIEIGIVDAADHADHPAEALVLACLRACGCDESELS